MRTGVTRRPERFGASTVDEKRDELRRALEAFESRVDAGDPEQVAALEEMRRETRELERLRGVWCVPEAACCWGVLRACFVSTHSTPKETFRLPLGATI